MATSSILITDAGLAEVVNAEQSGTAPVVITEVGYGTGQYTPTGDMMALREEFKRLTTIAGGAVGNNIIHLSARDDTTEAYTVYEVGLYTASGTLFAVCSQTVPIIQKASQSQALLAIDLAVTDFSADSIAFGDTNFLNPPATTTTLGVVELATNEETISGMDGTRAVTPKSLSARTSTESRTGLIRIAVPAEVLAGKDNTKAVTPYGLLSAFLKNHGDSGFQKLPNGLIVQWGKASIASDGSTVVAFPVAFPTGACFVNATPTGEVAADFVATSSTKGNATFKHNANGKISALWIALGF